VGYKGDCDLSDAEEGCTLVPLLLDSTNLDDIAPGLSSYQAIDFSESMLRGYRSLFSFLGRDFLSYVDRRNESTRRVSGPRRSADRRQSTLIQRMRLGFWRSYSQASGKGEFDELRDTLREKFKVIDLLKGEAHKYDYFDADNRACDPMEILEVSTHKAWSTLKGRGALKTVYLIEDIVEEINDAYRVEVSSKRRSRERRSAEERRKDK
jgi:hypothetical protein